MADKIQRIEISGRKKWGGWFTIRTLYPNYKYTPAVSGFWFWKRDYRKCINREEANNEALALAVEIAAKYAYAHEQTIQACESTRIDYWLDDLTRSDRKVWYKDINRE